MKKIAVMTIVLAGAFALVVGAPEVRAQGNVSGSIGGFYDELSPYGEWVECTYGECWVPRGVDAGWQPYTNGEWIYTRYGWTWVSSDPWGGNPYHYGTWALFGRYGWVWVPGTVWAPAWVTWSYSDRYVGWAPIPPRAAFGRAGYSGRPIVVHAAQYVFVPTNRFIGTSVASVRLEPGRNAEVFRQAKPVTRFDVSGGIVRNAAVPLATIQRAMGSKIETREIGTAHTTPRALSSGGVARSGSVAIVAPARDVKAARASWHAAGSAAPQQPQPNQLQQAKPQQQQQKGKPQPQHQAPQQQAPQPIPQQHAKPQKQQREQPQPQQQQQQTKEQKQPQQQPRVQPQQQPRVQPQQQRQEQPQQQPKPQQHKEENGKGKDEGKKD